MSRKELAIVGKARTRELLGGAMAVHGGMFWPRRNATNHTPAVADCTLVVGTTCGPDFLPEPSQLRDKSRGDCPRGAKGKVALLFGPEDHGLSNKDLEHCQLLVTIPTHPEYQSLNVAQAAVICLYELYVASLTTPGESDIQRAEAEQIERLFDIMRNSLLKIGFLDSENLSIYCSPCGAFWGAQVGR